MIKFVLIATFLAYTLSSTPQAPPSIEYLSMGYNIYQGDPLANSVDPGFTISPLFNFTYLQQQTTAGSNYLVPDDVSMANEESCVLNSASTAISGMNSYLNSLDHFVSVHGGFLFGSFSTSTTYTSLQQGFSEQSTFYTLSTGQCSVYTAKLDPINLPVPNTQFIQDAISYLGESDSDSHYQFLNAYGTHYVQEITMGSRLSIMSSVSESSWENLESQGISVTTAAQASFLFLHAGASSGTSTQNTQANAFLSVSSTYQMCTIGSVPPGDGNLTEWADEAIISPMPIQYSLVPMSDLFNSTSFVSAVNAVNSSSLKTIQANLQAALSGYCGYLLEQGSLSSCSPLPPDPALPVSNNSCVLCTSCGGIYSELQGMFDLSQRDGSDWFLDYSSECQGSILTNGNKMQQGVSLCCIPEISDEDVGSCKMCSSCGGNFSYLGGSIVDNQNWPDNDWVNWMGAYGDSCTGNVQVEPPQNGTGYSLCCDQPTMCAFCNTCGGSYPYENGDMSVDQSLGSFFEGYGDQCGGSYGELNSYSNGAGVRLCCSNYVSNQET